MTKYRYWAALLVFCATSVSQGGKQLRGAILIDNFSSATNDRFQNGDDPDQFIVSADLSGVGQNAAGRWATLIGPNTILSASHFRPTGTVTFYADNTASSPISIAVSTTDAERIGNTDLWMARLEQFAPSSLRIYDIARQQISAPGDPDGDFAFKGNDVIMTGRSPTSWPATQDQAYGTNIISGFLENESVSGLGVVDAFRMDYDTGATPYEAFLQVGDSGAPLFTDDGTGQLLLLGVNSFISTTSEGDPVASFVSYVGNDAAEIDALVSQWAAVPEPNALLPLLSCLLYLAAGRRRSPRQRKQSLSFGTEFAR